MATDEQRRAAELAAARSRIADLEHDVALLRSEALRDRKAAEQARADLAVMRGSTSWRLSAPLRAMAPIRTALQGPPGTRRSLRSPGGRQALVRSLREHGLRRTLTRVREELRGAHHHTGYPAWITAYDELDDTDRAGIRRHLTELTSPPTISVVMAAYDGDPAHLRAALDSVRGQLYDAWELCVCDDASPGPEVAAIFADYAARDPRIRYVRRETNGGIAAATNDAIGLATGAWVAFLDHDDLLAPHALYLIALEALRHPDTDLLYSDEDKIGRDGRRFEPHFKAQLDVDLLLAQNYLSHLTVVRRELLTRLGGLRTGFDGAQDHDLVLRVVAASDPSRVRHLPYVLYHWRQHGGSGTFSDTRLQEATAASRRAVTEVLSDPAVQVVPAPRYPLWNRVVWPLPDPAPPVTVIIPTRDRVALLRDCIDGLLQRTDYPALQVLVLDNDSSEPETLAYLRAVTTDPRVRVVAAPGPFNYSALNNQGVRDATTPLVLMLNNDIVVRDAGWLREMVSQVVRPGVGVVGARLLYADERVQHAGVVLGIGGVAGHSHKYAAPDQPGAFGRLVLAHGVSAVTGACLLTHRDLFLDLGGLDEIDLAVAFNDVDFCLRVRAGGRRVVYTPYAELFHLESASRGLEESPQQIARFNRESEVMRERWSSWLRDDPAYNPNLSLVHEDFSLAAPPRVVRPWVDR
jgi:GT2 family glycosyltransferase